MKHRRTDPACAQFRQPRSRIGWWLFDRARGRSCPICIGIPLATYLAQRGVR